MIINNYKWLKILKNIIKERYVDPNTKKPNNHIDLSDIDVSELNVDLNDINNSNIDKIIEDEVGFVFEKVLEDCGVFKWNEDGKKAMNKYMNDLKFHIEKVKEHEM